MVEYKRVRPKWCVSEVLRIYHQIGRISEPVRIYNVICNSFLERI